MKKIVLLFSFLFALHSLSAQLGDGSLRFGLQLSPSFSWMQSEAAVVNGNGVNLGLKLAMMGEYYFADNYAFTSGLGFAFNHGGTLRHDRPSSFWNLEGEFANADVKYSVQYIEIPLGLKMITREFGYLRYYGEPFVMLGFRSQARGTRSGGAGFAAQNDVAIKEFVNGAGLSWGLGLGAEYSLSESTAIVGGLYFQNMFTNMVKKGSVQPTDVKANFDAITLRLGILF